MKKLKKEVKIGIFGIAMVILLFWGINFLKGKDLFTPENTYYALYDQVNGLQKSAAVVIKGFKVGYISDMNYNAADGDKIVVKFTVKSKYKIPVNSKARIFSGDLLGGKSIELELGNSTEFMHNGDTLRSEQDLGILEMAGNEIEQLKQRAMALMGSIEKTFAGVNKVLNDENIGNIGSTLNHISNISGNVDRLVASEYVTLKELIDNLNAMSRKLNENAGRIDNIVGNVEGFTDSLNNSNIPTLIANMSRTLADLNVTIERINRGEGTVGKMINDEQLYDSLVTASSNLSRLLEDIKENPKRYINVSVFGGKSKSK